MKVLVAEDEPISRQLLEKFLVQWGYEVVTAADGDEAWWLLQKDDAPKLAILDWMMPGMDGLQICQEVRRRAGEPYVYIILLTAKSQKQDIIEGLEAGADDYISKPFDPAELRVRLRAGTRILDMQDYLLSMREAAQFPATHDFVTGLWNREAILGMLRREVTRERREGIPVAIVIADLDQFKQLNYTYGPLGGDAVLRETARRLRVSARIYDSIGRYGGGEFLIILPGCDSKDALQQAEKFRAAVSDKIMDILGQEVRVTMSVGLATTNEVPDGDFLVRAAEMAVNKAKAAGRNRVEGFEKSDPLERTARRLEYR